jgi:hypothetical protein
LNPAPHLELDSRIIRQGGGQIEAVWRISNSSSRPVELLETWLPHGRFHAARQAIDPPILLPPGQVGEVDREIRLSAEPGEDVENAFLNLQVRYRGVLWRMLVRLRVGLEFSGAMTITVESITSHPVGFAGTKPATGN